MKAFRDFVIVLVALLALPLFAQTPTDPVAWLKAENNATDATTNGNNGVVTGTVPYVTGRVGNAFNFTGNVANYVCIPNSASLQSSLLSVEYWVNFNSATNAVTVAKRNGSSDAWQAGIVYSGGNFLLQFVGNTSGGLFDWYSAPLSSPVGVWTHVAVTYDGSTVKGYINGSQVLTQAVTLQLSSRTADIFVGNYAGTSLPLDAKLDELSIYNRALSAAEVLAIFQAGSTGKTSPPTVTSLSPNSGSTAGGTNVTITGANFTGATSVTFGGNAATNVTVVNSTTITATTPARTAGTASVIVTTPGGTNAANSLYTYLAPGDLDPLNTSLVGNYVLATAVQPDGKLILAGKFTTVLGVARNNLARLNADGSLDTTFNPNPNGDVNAVTVQPDGKILLGGSFTNVVATTRNSIARLNADGTLDTGFNPNANASPMSIVLQADGKVLLGGDFTTLQPNGAASATTRNRLARLNSDGTLDTAFNPNANDRVVSMALQADGKILISGYFLTLQPNGAASATTRNRIARLNADGTLDTGFNPNANNWVNSLALESDGQILLGGDFTSLQPNGATSPTTRNRIARLNADGTLDTGFDPNANGSVLGIAVQADGKVLLGGYFITLQPNGAASSTARNCIARVNADGTLDAAFDPKPNNALFGVALQADGKVLLGGLFSTLQPNGAASATPRNLFARVANDAAVSTVSVPSFSQVQWTRSGSAPEVSRVTFELSTDSGASWSTLGNGTRVGSTSNWQLTGLSLPASGVVRARGATPHGYFNGSSGLVESTATFSVVLAPTVSGVTPATGSTLGGTNVTITGTNFTGAAGVTFGGNAATNVSVVNATTITATTPAKSAGAVSVIVTTPNGSNAANTLYTYVTPPAPTLTSISPSSGSTSGGTSVTLTGTNFTGATGVTFAGNAATSVNVVNASTITATTPSGTAGTASVVVTTPGGSNAANSLYTYFNPLVTANFTSAGTVPVTAASYTATGTTVNFTLGFAPATGTTLTVVNNTGLGFISGTFANLAQGQAVALSFGGVTYNFVTNYYGGTGNDLVLVWANTRVAVWGGLQSRVPTNLPTDGVLSGKTVVAVASGSNHNLALCSDSTVAAWGANSWGQLGDSTFTHSMTTPVAVTTTGALAGKTVIAVSAGNSHSLALCSDGTVVSWGANDSGQLGNPSVSYSNAPIAVTTNGALSGKTVVAISAGSLHNLALCSDGTVVAWGSNTGGVLGNSTLASSNVPVGVTATGLLAGKVVVAISAGSGHSLALCSDGTLTAWGGNQYGQLGNTSVPYSPEPIAVNTNGVLSGRTVTAISAGGLHSVVLCSDGTLAAWGLNEEGRVGDGSTTLRDLPVAVTSSGALAGKTVAAISSGDIHNLALCTDGTLIVWGGNYNGQLGDGSTDHSLVPIALTTGMPPGGGRFVGAKSGSSSSATLTLIAAGAPAVNAVTPFSGATTGGTNVTITGTDFTGATGVTFGGTAATNVTVFNDTTITATTPAGTLGAVSVVVTTPRGSNPANSLYTYTNPTIPADPPTVTGVSPASGSTYGGTSVTISGADFTGATAVTFGGTATSSFSVVNATTITAVTPAHAAGPVSVVVTTPAGSNAANSAFTFVTPPAPTVTGVSPTNGPRLGGTSVTITGTDFAGTTGVTFGGVAASFTVVNVTTITATTPASAVGAVSVVVTTPSGSNAANSLFTYLPVAPTLTGVSPARGVDTGGTTVTLTGTDFTGATSVRFGTREASSFTVVNSTTITAVTPSENDTVSVIVTTPYGSNAANSLFTFFPRTPTNTQLSSSQPTSAFLSPPTFTVSVSTLTGAPVPGKIALFIDNVLLERKAVDSGGWATFTPTPAQLRGGSHVIRAIYNDDLSSPDYYGSEAAAIGQTVTKSPVSIALDSATLTQTYDGASHPVTATVGTLPPSHTSSGVQVGITYDGSATAPTNAGTYAVLATINDPSLSGTASGTLTINRAAGSYTFQNLVFAYDGQPHPAIVTVTPQVPLTVTYDRLVNNVPTGSPTSTAPTNPGNYRVIVSNPNYTLTPSTTNPLTITARGVSITIGNLEVPSDGTPKPVTITTIPPGVNVAVTYQRPNDYPYPNPAQAFPGDSLDVYVEATVNRVGYEGKATAIQRFRPRGAVTLSLTGPATGQSGPQTYQVTMTGRVDGRIRTGTVTLLKGTETVGSIQMVDTYEGRATLTSTSLEPGTHAITARYEGNDSYLPATSNVVTTTIAKLPLTLVPTSPLTVTYDGRGKSVSFRGPGTPPIPVEFDVTYDNSTTLPVNATNSPVQVRATIKSSDPRYTGTTTVPLTITKAPATLALGSLTQTFDGTPKPVSVITTPAGVATSVNYGGGINPTPPSAVGSYFVSAGVTDPNYTGAPVSGTLNIIAGSVQIDISDTLQTFTPGKSSYPVTVRTNPVVAYSVTYNSISYDVPGEKRGPFGAGTYDVVVTITQPGYTGTASATLVVKPLVTVNHPEVTLYGSNFNNPGDVGNGASAVDGSFVSPGTPFPLIEGAKLRFFDSVENEVRYRFVRWKDGNPNQERLIEANTRVYTPVVRPEIKILAEAHTTINGVEQKSTVGGTVVPLTNGRTYAKEREVVTFVANPNPGYVVDRWEHHDFSAAAEPKIYSLPRFSHLYGTEFEEFGAGFVPVKAYFTRGYTVTTGVNVPEAGSVQVVREDGYGYDANGQRIGRLDPAFSNAAVPVGINTVARAIPQPGYLFNTWIVEGARPVSLAAYVQPWSLEMQAELTKPKLVFTPTFGVNNIKLTAVFVRKVPGPVASFTRINSLGFSLGVIDLSVTRNPILQIRNAGTGPMTNAKIVGVEISGARMKPSSNDVEELTTGGFFEFYLSPNFRPLTPEEIATPDPYFIQYTEYAALMIANIPRLTKPRDAITTSNPINIGTLMPGDYQEFNNLEYFWPKADLSLGLPIGGVSFSLLQYRVTIWITSDELPATPVSFWTN